MFTQILHCSRRFYKNKKKVPAVIEFYPIKNGLLGRIYCKHFGEPWIFPNTKNSSSKYTK